MDFPVSADTVRQTVRDYGIQWWNLRECSLCGSSIGYMFAPEASAVAFNSNCDCTRYHSAPEERDFENVAHQFNMQTTPGVAQQMWDEFLKCATKQPPKPIGTLGHPFGDPKANPVITISPEELINWLRSIVDAHGLSDRAVSGAQIAWEEDGRQIRHVIPEITVMASNIPNSRVK